MAQARNKGGANPQTQQFIMVGVLAVAMIGFIVFYTLPQFTSKPTPTADAAAANASAGGNTPANAPAGTLSNTPAAAGPVAGPDGKLQLGDKPAVVASAPKQDPFDRRGVQKQVNSNSDRDQAPVNSASAPPRTSGYGAPGGRTPIGSGYAAQPLPPAGGYGGYVPPVSGGMAGGPASSPAVITAVQAKIQGPDRPAVALTGVLDTEGAPGMALLMVDTERRVVQVGDVLPKNYRVKKISQNGIELVNGRDRYFVALGVSDKNAKK
jgi:hypothetical protein